MSNEHDMGREQPPIQQTHRENDYRHSAELPPAHDYPYERSEYSHEQRARRHGGMVRKVAMAYLAKPLALTAAVASAGVLIYGIGKGIGDSAGGLLPGETINRVTGSTLDAYDTFITGVGSLMEQASTGFDSVTHPIEIVEAGERLKADQSFGVTRQDIFFSGKQITDASFLWFGSEMTDVHIDASNIRAVTGDNVELGYDAEEDSYFIRVNEASLILTGLTNHDVNNHPDFGARFVSLFSGNTTNTSETTNMFLRDIEDFYSNHVDYNAEMATKCAGALSIATLWSATDEVQAKLAEADSSDATREDITVQLDTSREVSQFEEGLILQLRDRRESGRYTNVTVSECHDFLEEHTTLDYQELDEEILSDIQQHVSRNHESDDDTQALRMQESYGMTAEVRLDKYGKPEESNGLQFVPISEIDRLRSNSG